MRLNTTAIASIDADLYLSYFADGNFQSALPEIHAILSAPEDSSSPDSDSASNSQIALAYMAAISAYDLKLMEALYTHYGKRVQSPVSVALPEPTNTVLTVSPSGIAAIAVMQNTDNDEQNVALLQKAREQGASYTTPLIITASPDNTQKAYLLDLLGPYHPSTPRLLKEDGLYGYSIVSSDTKTIKIPNVLKIYLESISFLAAGYYSEEDGARIEDQIMLILRTPTLRNQLLAFKAVRDFDLAEDTPNLPIDALDYDSLIGTLLRAYQLVSNADNKADILKAARALLAHPEYDPSPTLNGIINHASDERFSEILIFAMECNSLKLVEALLNANDPRFNRPHGHPCRQCAINGTTPMHYAIEHAPDFAHILHRSPSFNPNVMPADGMNCEQAYQQYQQSIIDTVHPALTAARRYEFIDPDGKVHLVRDDRRVEAINAARGAASPHETKPDNLLTALLNISSRWRVPADDNTAFEADRRIQRDQKSRAIMRFLVDEGCGDVEDDDDDDDEAAPPHSP